MLFVQDLLGGPSVASRLPAEDEEIRKFPHSKGTWTGVDRGSYVGFAASMCW